MRNVLIGFALFSIVGCTEPVPFERDHPRDLDGMNYIPSPPQFVRIYRREGKSVEIIWRDIAQRETGFEIERSIDYAPFEPIRITEPSVTSLRDQTTERGTYVYRLRSIGAGEPSHWVETVPLTLGVWSYASLSFPGGDCKVRRIFSAFDNDISILTVSGVYTFDPRELKWSSLYSSPVLSSFPPGESIRDIHALPNGNMVVLNAGTHAISWSIWNPESSTWTTEQRVGSTYFDKVQMTSVLVSNNRVIVLSEANVLNHITSTDMRHQFRILSVDSGFERDLPWHSEDFTFPQSVVYLPSNEILVIDSYSARLFNLDSETWRNLNLPGLYGFSAANSFILSDSQVYMQGRSGFDDFVFDIVSGSVTNINRGSNDILVQMANGGLVALSTSGSSLRTFHIDDAAWIDFGDPPGHLLTAVQAISGTSDGRLYAFGTGHWEDGAGGLGLGDNQCKLMVSEPLL